MRKKLRKNVSGELKPRPKSKRIRRETVLGAKGIKRAVEAGKVVCLDTLIFPRPQVVGVTLKSYRDRSGPGADYYGLLRLDSGKTQRLDGLKRTRVIIIDEAQANPMMSTADAAGRTMTVFKLSGAEKKLLERRGIDPWDLVGQRPESLQRMISGLQASERADVAGVGATVFQTAGGPQAVPATLQGMIGSTFKGWTLKDLKGREGLLPLSARLEREVQGRTVKLRVLPIGSDPSQQLLVIRTGASKAVAKLIRAKRGAAYDLKDVEKVLTRAADEATKWLSGKGRGWKAHEASAVPNPKKPSKKELFKFWAQEFDAELKDEEHRREAAENLAKAKEDVILWLAGEPGVKPQAQYYNTVVRHGDDTELTIMAIRSLIKAGVVKKSGKGQKATLILTPVGARYAMALEKQLESRALEMGIGPDYDENPKRKKKAKKKTSRKKKPQRKNNPGSALGVEGADPRLERLFEYFSDDRVFTSPKDDPDAHDFWMNRFHLAASQKGSDFGPALRRFLVYILVGSKKYSVLDSLKKSNHPKKRDVEKIIVRTAELIKRGAPNKELESANRAARFVSGDPEDDEDDEYDDYAGSAAYAAAAAAGYGDEVNVVIDAAAAAADAASADGGPVYELALLAGLDAAAAARVDYANALLDFVEQEAGLKPKTKHKSVAQSRGGHSVDLQGLLRQAGYEKKPTRIPKTKDVMGGLRKYMRGPGYGDDPEVNPKRKSRKNGAKKAAKKKAREAKGRARPYPWDKDRIAKSPFKSKAAAQRAETLHKMGESIGSTQLSSLRAMGRLPRSDGRYELGKKYR